MEETDKNLFITGLPARVKYNAAELFLQSYGKENRFAGADGRCPPVNIGGQTISFVFWILSRM